MSTKNQIVQTSRVLTMFALTLVLLLSTLGARNSPVHAQEANTEPGLLSSVEEWAEYTNNTGQIIISYPSNYRVSEWKPFGLILESVSFLAPSSDGNEHGSGFELTRFLKSADQPLVEWIRDTSSPDSLGTTSNLTKMFFEQTNLNSLNLEKRVMAFWHRVEGEPIYSVLYDLGPEVLTLSMVSDNSGALSDSFGVFINSLRIDGQDPDQLFGITNQVETGPMPIFDTASEESSHEIAAQIAGYLLPWPNGVAKTVNQGWGPDPVYSSHDAQPNYYAYDFRFTEGQEVRASAPGTIQFSRGNVGPDVCGGPSYGSTVNYVTIYHEDGKATTYLHLRSVVRGSGTVSQGELIGYSGKTGWTNCGAHLHFQRQDQGGWFTNSAEVYFLEYPGQTFFYPSSLTSQNGGGSLNPPALLSPSQGQTLTSRSVHFTWQSPNATNQNGYTFRLSTNSNPDSQPWLRDTGLGNAYTSYDYSFSSDGTFYWHMRAWNTSNQASSWITRSFVINTSNNPPANFTWCADEGARCNFSGTADVVYGALNSFTSPRLFTNGVDCNNTVFSDPISGTRKACYYKLTSPPPTGNLHIEYFNDKNLGSRCYDSYENTTYIFKNWGNGSPASGCNSDNFSARFTGTYNFSGGNYNFHCQHDDGCRIFVGGVERLNAWWDSSFTGHDWSGSLSGNHEVKIEFYDSGGDARLEAFWSGPGFLPTGPACTSNEWCGSYYGNKDLAGTPALNRNEGTANINYDWENSGVGFGFPNDNFSVRWQRNVSFSAGRYRFHIRVDDGGRLWVNNNKVIDEWRDQGAQEYTADVDLNGVIPVSFEYYENGGGAVAEMWWETLAQPPSANFDAWPLSGPAPFTTTLHIVDMSGITNCSWNYGDGQSSTSCTQLHDHTYNNPGSYTVSLTVSGPGGSNPMTRFNYITVNPTLNVNKTGIGSGNVTSNPSGINCGATCSYSFPYNTPVTLSASAATGSSFTGWSGAACSGTGPCTVAMSAAISVSANFNLQPSYTLGVNKGGTGSGTVISNPSGINCGSDCSELYTSGTVVTLTANPTLGHTFAGWSGDADCADGQVTMNAGKTCTATFNSINYTLTVNKTGAGSGTVTSNPAGINCGSDCSETYALGIVVVLTATPATDAIFAGWSGDADCSDGQVTMSASKICTATFNSAPHPSSLLRNPSFEDDSNNDGKPDIWSTNAKFTRSSDIAAMNGTYVGKLRTTDNSGVTIQQVVQSLTPGTTYDFSSWTNIPGTSDTFTFKLQVKWRNASNSAISTQIIKTYTASTNGWDQVTASLVAPAGTTNALIQMIVSSLNGTIYIDDFSFGSSTVQQLPDLLIESITSIPANPQVNEFVEFSVVVRNQGQVDALGFWVDLFIDNSFPSDCSGIGQAYQYVDSLAAGASQTLVIGYTGFGNEGSHAVHGITDTNCSIEENDEDNNKNSINVMAGGDLDLIFANSFEDDDCFVTQWTACVDDSGDLQFTDPPAPLKDNASMMITVEDNNPMYVTSDHPDAERRYRGRFYFDPNSISMVSGNAHFILYGYNGTSKVVLRVEFRNSSGSYQIRAGLLNDASSWTNSSWSTITDAPHFIEFDWRAASVTGANNGGLTLWMDGVQKANLAAVDNDTWRIDRVRLGAVNGIDAGTRGTYYFDAFESRRETYIGP